MKKLRFIEESEFPGALNMAIDNFLAIGEEQDFDFCLRLYRWVNPTLSCGFHQNIEKRVNLEKCRALKVDVVKRPTGGRELMHDGDISFSITGRFPDSIISDKDLFRKTGEVILAGLQAMGIDADLSTSPKKAGVVNQGPCLAAVSQYEITVDGKKIVPVAQRVFRDSILIHGSIPFRTPKIGTAHLLNVSEPEVLQKKIEGLATDIGKLVQGEIKINRFKEALVESFSRNFEGNCRKLDLERWEIDGALQTLDDWKILS